MSRHATILKIALATPLRQVFDYLPHENANPEHWQAGMRVSVPFGKQTRVGIILDITNHADVNPDKLKRIHHVIDHEPILPESLLRLATWASEYYHYPLGDAIFTTLPTRLRLGKDPYPEELLKKKKTPELVDGPLFHCDLTLNDEQLSVLNHLQQHESFAVTLLEGITGSGKTLVYMMLIAKIIAQGKQALVLVPEIGLTPQTIARFQQFFRCHIVAFHSALTPKQRALSWLAARRGDARIIIGTRSAIFTPMAQPGIIIIDEEHDSSYKQQEGFRYSARDLAVIRAQHENIPLLLGSATPSSETYHNAVRDRYQHQRLTIRAGGANPPQTRLLDIRNQKLIEGISQPLLFEIEAHLKNHGQVLLFVNRRGFAPILICHQCGWLATCKHCDARLTLHRTSKELRCHHCTAVYPVIHLCGKCHAPTLIPLGVGTQRLEEMLTKQFPAYRVQRLDRDTTTRKGQLEAVLDNFANHHTDILIGTQMLAKGHDFKDLTLVAILDIDSGLYSSDFRAVERMGQLITQVAGRAGRAHRAGTVMLQTHNPDNPLLQLLMDAPYQKFVQRILEQRQQAALPPFHYFALLRADANKAGIPITFLQQVRKQALKSADRIEILGPIPAYMEKRADRYRAQLLISARQRSQLKSHLRTLIEWLRTHKHGLGSSLRWSIDVDPQEM